MGKNILVQRRGRGYFPFRAPTHRRLHPVGYNSVTGHSTGWVRDLVHEVARGAPLARRAVGGSEDVYLPAPEGLFVGQKIEIGSEVPAETGNIKSLGKILEGTMICNIELRPGDGGSLARSSGTFAMVVSHTAAGTELRMPSGRKWPAVKGQPMIAASHPHGGGRHQHAGKPTTVGRWTSPGRKVGNIAARQTGRAKRRSAR